ncbi:hypothetical protein [Vibrio owensii]|uniref:hypothetical protein n=1 Tax=Vibrio harveyi group TaxID=717610 RepID=UPI003CC6C330
MTQEKFKIVTASMVVHPSVDVQASTFVNNAMDMSPYISSIRIEDETIQGFKSSDCEVSPFDLVDIKRCLSTETPTLVIIDETYLSGSSGSIATLFLNGTAILTSNQDSYINLDIAADNISNALNGAQGPFKVIMTDELLARSIEAHRVAPVDIEDNLFLMFEGEAEQYFANLTEGYSNEDLYRGLTYMLGLDLHQTTEEEKHV